MNICMVLEGHDFPPDIRVEKEARALRAAGHTLTIVCELVKQGQRQDTWAGCRIIRVPRLPQWQRGINRLMWLLTMRNWRWERAIGAILNSEKFDALHIHDLPLVGTALALGKQHHLPVMADLHENYSAAVQYYYEGNSLKSRLGRALNNPARWQQCETEWCREVDRVLVVVEEAQERLVGLGVPADKITVIENTEDTDYFQGIPIQPDIMARYQNDFVISYIGGFGGRHRGLDTAVAAMPKILQNIPNARLLLVGKGSIKPTLEKMAAERSLQDKVTFIEWQPFDQVPSLIAASAVCLVPHQSNPHTEATSPHKLFQYMLMSKPVVVSSCKPLQRVVKETGAGLVFEAGNSDSLAETIIRLQDAGLRQRLGEAGHRAVLEKYNWRVTAQKLLGVYEQLGRA